MRTHSHVISTLNQGLILDVTLGELGFTAYVVVSEPDISRVADLVPKDHYDKHGDLHVTAISTPDETREQINDIAFNMNPGDAAVFLCSDEAAYMAVLEELGQQTPSRFN